MNDMSLKARERINDLLKNNKPLKVAFIDLTSGTDGETAIPKSSEFSDLNVDVIIEAFLINYPYCWQKQKWLNSVKDGKFVCNAALTCTGKYDQNQGIIKSQPYNKTGTDTCTDSLYTNTSFFPINTITSTDTKKIGQFTGFSQKCNFDPEAYNTYDDLNGNQKLITYYNSLHLGDKQSSKNLRATVPKDVILLIGIGGWNMGGSSDNRPTKQGSPGYINNWYACLKDPVNFANEIKKFMDHIKIVERDRGYDGVDIDCETILAMFDSESCKKNNVTTNQLDCYPKDNLNEYMNNNPAQKVANSLFVFFETLKKLDQNLILSMSPRIRDIGSFDTKDTIQINFIGAFLDLLSKNQDSSLKQIDLLNVQVYNDLDYYTYTVKDNKIKCGNYLIEIFKLFKDKYLSQILSVQLGYTPVAGINVTGTRVCDILDEYLQKQCVDFASAKTILTDVTGNCDGVMIWKMNYNPKTTETYKVGEAVQFVGFPKTFTDFRNRYYTGPQPPQVNYYTCDTDGNCLVNTGCDPETTPDKCFTNDQCTTKCRPSSNPSDKSDSNKKKHKKLWILIMILLFLVVYGVIFTVSKYRKWFMNLKTVYKILFFMPIIILIILAIIL